MGIKKKKREKTNIIQMGIKKKREKKQISLNEKHTKHIANFY
jgi:hypothetical protein